MYSSDEGYALPEASLLCSFSSCLKSNHVFPYTNLPFPVEMFIAVMEQKHKFGKQCEANIVLDALNTIPSPDVSEQHSPIQLWKESNFDRLAGLEWAEFKTELLDKFERSSLYDTNARAQLLQSICRGDKERLDVFLVRISNIVSYIENGEMLRQYPPSEAWIKVLLLVGLDSESKKHLPNAIDEFTSDQLCKHVASKCPKLFFEVQEQDNQIDDDVEHGVSFNPLKLSLPKEENYINIKIEKNWDGDSEELKIKLKDISTRININDGCEMVENETEYKETSEVEPRRGKRKRDILQTLPVKKIAKAKLTSDLHKDDAKEYKGTIYNCSECDQTFRNESKRDFHLKVKHTRYLSCNICFEPLDGSIRSYTLHKQASHGDGKLCEVCNEAFDTKQDVKTHQDEEHLGAQYKCKLCPAEIKYATIKSHMEKVHNPEKPFERRPWVRQHRRKRISSSTTERKQIIKNLSLMSHAHLHGSMSLKEYFTRYKHIVIYQDNSSTSGLNQDENDFCCGICNDKLHSVSFMKKHFENKHDGKKFKCDDCDYLGKRLDNLAHHRFNRHGLSSQGYDIMKCSESGCNYAAVFPDKMALHELSKHNIESDRYETLNCNFGGCDYRTVDPKLLRIHVDGVHNNIRYQRPSTNAPNKTIKCTFCSNSDGKGEACDHQIDSEKVDAKVFKCEHTGCDKEFTSLHSCKSHMETVHLGLRKFQCDECKKSYSAKPALENHKKRVHGSGEVKKHVCHMCGMETVHYANFKRHLVQVHGEPGPKSFQIVKDETKDDATNLCPCPTCGRLFHSEIKRNAHMLSHTRWKTCSICFMSLGVDGSTGSWDAYKQHKEKYHGNGKLCEVCDTLFDKVEEVKKHQDENHSGAQYKCKQCTAELKYKAVKQHMEKAHKIIL